MTNNQFQDLRSINCVEDISEEEAAACSGGRVILYFGANQTGTSLSFVDGSVANLGNFGFNNKTSSIEVTKNERWRLWTNTGFKGRTISYGQGKFNLLGIFNNSVSSLSRTA